MTVEPISMSVPLLSAIAAASSDGAFTGGPRRFETAPQSVVMCASGAHCPRTMSLST